MKRYFKYVKLVCKKPLLVFRILSNYFRMLVLKQDVLRKVDISLTFRCVCDCDKCSSVKMFDPERKELTLGEITDIAKQSLALGAIQLNLVGGEPLLRQDIFEIIRNLRPSRAFISINTTGLLLDRKMIGRLRDAGVDMIKMSLDSPEASEHDKYRNSPGCFEKVIENLGLIKKTNGLRGHISTVTIPGNIRSGKIFDILRIAEKFSTTLALTVPAPVGRWSNNYNILISREDRKILNNLLKSHPLVTEDLHSSYKEVKCPAGTESFYITSYGDVIPCSLLQISFGNIRREKLKDIYGRMINFRSLKKSVPVCKAGESGDFIEKWLKPIDSCSRFPVDIDNHPSFQRTKTGYI